MQNKKDRSLLLSPACMLICILLILLSVIVCHFLSILLCFTIGIIILYLSRHVKLVRIWLYFIGILVLLSFVIFFVITGNLLTSVRYSIKLIIAYFLIMFYINQTTLLEEAESLNFICRPLSFFGLLPEKVSYQIVLFCLYVKEFRSAHNQALFALQTRGLDRSSLRKRDYWQYRNVYFVALKERLEKKARNFSDMLEVKLFRVDAYRTENQVKINDKKSIMSIATCVFIFVLIVVKEVMV